ncbi:MAG: nucleoside diphosphate kinase regulator [Kiritimatiellia bacterium]|nr:nucleoside diphosphate kinase regulator [Lentisphaerota bacterium]
MRKKIHVTSADLERLRNVLLVSDNGRDRQDYQELDEELQKARIVDQKDISPTVVTMNSRVRLRDTATGEEMIFTLVFPENSDIGADRISVVSPIGTAILGYAAGDTIAWQVPQGKRSIKIEEVLYQPEAAGDYHL